MQIPDKKVLEKYNIDINSITPFRDGYLIASPGGRYVLKKCDSSQDRILYIYRAKEYLASRGFYNTDKYFLNVEGNPYVKLNDNLYTVTTIPEGEECNLLDRNDIGKAARALAELHKASVGFREGIGPEAKSELYKIPLYFTKRLDEIKKLKKLARKGKKEFDNIFLKYADSFIRDAESAIELLDKSEYSMLCKKAESEGSFCHHDYTHSNILITDNCANIINFDFICPELGIYDLANFLRRKLRKCSWDFDEGQFIIEEYMSVKDLSNEELNVMGIMFMFPQKMWRVCNRYYNSKRSFYEKGYLWQLREVIEEREPSRAFIDKYYMEYCSNRGNTF